jgi:hypothetical protein
MQRMTPPVSPKRAELRKHVLTLLVAVVVLDAIMVGAYYAFHVRDRLQKTQMTFVAVWIVLTLIVVTTIMKRIRQVRRRR